MSAGVGGAAAVLLLVVAAADAFSSGLEVSVAPDQTVTVIGRGDSVRSVVEELCWRSGAALRYDADDQPFAIRAVDQPLEVVLDKLLARRSYLLTTRRGAGGAQRVSAVHVLGAEGPDHRQRRAALAGPQASEPSPPSFVLPVRVFEEVFGETSDERRDAAIRGLVEHIRSDPTRLQAFLGADLAPMADVLRRHPAAPAVVHRLLDFPDLDEAVRAKLTALASMLD